MRIEPTNRRRLGCTDRIGRQKNTYYNKKDAKHAAQQGRHKNVYQCVTCGHYHLTTRRPYTDKNTNETGHNNA